jgi:aryl-alcohol dehydrogenase-like predicted oxidoreductase
MQSKDLLLGTAQWGWTVPRAEAFRLLDAWVEAEQREVDTATNYPINRQPADFRAAEAMLEEYVRAHGLHDLRILMKVGGRDNMRSPEPNLQPSFLLMLADEYHRRFDDNLGGFMVHWDPRADAVAIGETVATLARIAREHGFAPGLSGLAHPELYARANAAHGLTFDIQFKHNLLQSDLDRYEPFFDGPHRFLAYGLNAGGLKLDQEYAPDSTLLARGGQPDQAAALLDKLRQRLPAWNTAFVRPPLKTMNHLGLVHAGFHPRIGGLILGASTVAQLRETLDFYRNFEVFDYEDVWEELKKMGA